MQSRIEDILQAMIDGTSSSELPPAQSRNEALLMGVLDKLNDLDVDPEVVKQAVDDWLDDHPEATTTVEDGAITYAKLDSTLQEKSDDVDELKSAFDDLEQYVRDLSPVVTSGPSPVVSVSDAAPLDAEDVSIAIEPVQSGSGDPAPDNVRPISGWTGANVSRTGKNLFDKTTAIAGKFVRAANTSDEKPLGSEDSNVSWSCSDYIRVAPNSRYTTTLPSYYAAGAAGIVFYSDQTVESAISGVSTSMQGSADYSFTTPSTCRYLRFSWNNSDGNDCQLELGSTATAYEPYQDNTYAVDWEDEAGTIYGGTLDLTAGTLTVDRVKMVFDGTQSVGLANWEPNSESVGWLYSYNTTPGIYVPFIGNEVTALIADRLKTVKYGGSSGVYGGTFSCISIVAATSYTWGIAMRVADTSLTTAAAINTWLSQNPVTVVYPLATPTVYTLDPVTLTLLRGNNALWAECGDTTLTYRQDVATLLSALTAPDETNMTANVNYAVNSFFTVGGTLYRATAAIATGETIVPGSNCMATTIADQLTYLYTQI